MTGMAGPVGFERAMSSDLLGYYGMVDHWLQARFPAVYSPSLAFDCHSHGMLECLQRGYTGMSPQEIQHTMFKTALTHTYDTIKQHGLPERISAGYYTRENVDFAKLDPNFINYLPLLRRRIWKMRCEGMSLRTIAQALEHSVNSVAVNCYHIRKAYVKWMAMRGSFSQNYYEFIPERKHYHDVVRMRFELGYSLALIASTLSINPRYVSTVLFRVREALRLKHIQLPSCWMHIKEI